MRAIHVQGDVSTYPSKVPGLRYDVRRIGTSRYFSVTHVQSGRNVINLHGAPFVGKIADYVTLADLTFAGFDWTVPPEEMNTDAGESLVLLFRSKLERESKYGGDWRMRADTLAALAQHRNTQINLPIAVPTTKRRRSTAP